MIFGSLIIDIFLVLGNVHHRSGQATTLAAAAALFLPPLSAIH